MQSTATNTMIDEDTTLRSGLRTILYVEDNLDSLKLMQSIVGQIPDTRLLIAHNARLGIDLAKKKKPDLILLDINMPGLNGIEALGILRHMEITRHIPIIALTANTEPESKKRGLAAGFNAYMTKPVIVKELIEKIGAFFKGIE